MSPTRIQPLVLATVLAAATPARTVLAQDHRSVDYRGRLPENGWLSLFESEHLAVEERAITEAIHQDLADSMRDDTTPRGPGTGNFFWGGGGSPSRIWSETPWNYSLAPEATRLSHPESSFLALAAGFTGIIALTVSALDWWLVGVVIVPAGTALAMSPAHVRATIRSFYNRMEVHYRLEGTDGWTEDGSCLAFFALAENPDGSRDLHYALDNCSHAGLFPQAVPTGDGDPRIGPDGVDAWDRLLGQDMVVAKGSVPIHTNSRN